ncbi:MAG: hypothetical protein SFU27_14185 [Thermonemataceae bacterium]|nr:hypothetical protein [Thermonemataceae bacterium]
MKKISFLLTIAILIANFAFGQYSVTDFYEAKVKELSNPDQPGGAFKVIPIVKDVKNGFISFKTDPPLGYMIGVTESRTDMGYFVAKNGKKFVATADIAKTQGYGWSGGMPSFYELTEGYLANITESLVSSEQITEILGNIPKGRDIFSKVPKIGTTIQIGTIDRKQGEKSFKVAYEMLFDVNNGTFKIVKK